MKSKIHKFKNLKIKTMSKNLIIAITLFMTALTTISFTASKGGKVIMMITIEVKNAAEWKKNFDAGAPVREKAGIKVISICSAFDNENQITVIEEATSEKAANDFLAVLKARQQAGDMTKLEIKLFDKID
jgi:hypothetical protein